jgi:hypothetical protein
VTPFLEITGYSQLKLYDKKCINAETQALPQTSTIGFSVSSLATRAHIAAASADHFSPLVWFAAITTTGGALLLDQPF